VPDDASGSYDFGLGAGFYVDATQAPLAGLCGMWTYRVPDLLVDQARPTHSRRIG
jgi:S-formylglutathione hydrolase